MKRICSGELGDSAKAIEITGAQVQAWLAQVSDLCLNTITFSECASTALGLENPITPLRVHYVCLRVENQPRMPPSLSSHSIKTSFLCFRDFDNSEGFANNLVNFNLAVLVFKNLF